MVAYPLCPERTNNSVVVDGEHSAGCFHVEESVEVQIELRVIV
jgi:hypothetical protein